MDEVTKPNVEPWLELGAPKIGVLVRLMNCVMNWKFVLSEIWNPLMMLRSDVASPGPRKEPAAQVPNVPGVPGATAFGLSSCMPMIPPVTLGSVSAPLPDCETPATQFGRGEALPVRELSGPCG